MLSGLDVAIPTKLPRIAQVRVVPCGTHYAVEVVYAQNANNTHSATCCPATERTRMDAPAHWGSAQQAGRLSTERTPSKVWIVLSQSKVFIRSSGPPHTRQVVTSRR